MQQLQYCKVLLDVCILQMLVFQPLSIFMKGQWCPSPHLQGNWCLTVHARKLAQIFDNDTLRKDHRWEYPLHDSSPYVFQVGSCTITGLLWAQMPWRNAHPYHLHIRTKNHHKQIHWGNVVLGRPPHLQGMCAVSLQGLSKCHVPKILLQLPMKRKAASTLGVDWDPSPQTTTLVNRVKIQVLFQPGPKK